LFEVKSPTRAGNPPSRRRHQSGVKLLGELLREAVRLTPGTSAALYTELRGLSPPNNQKIDIARIAYANKWYGNGPTGS
jgi:hypothetical protein